MDCSGALAAEEVEIFSPPQEKYRDNDEGKTLQDVLTEEGEKWMKDAARSYSTAATLVVTVTYLAFFTMPDSINIDNGPPILVKAFVVSSMFAILFSLASFLMFFCILGQKILCPLHWKLMFWGVLTLFTSLIAMITAFCAGILIEFGHKKTRLPTPVIVLYYVTATFFAVQQILLAFRKSSTPRQYTKGINSEAIIPKYLKSALHYLFALVSNQFTVVVDEHYDGGISRNPLYDAAEVYLRTKISPDIRRFKVGKTPKQKSLDISVEKGEEIIDRFDNNLELKWRFISVKPQNQNGYENEKRFFELSFNNKYGARVLNEYLPFVLAKSEEIKSKETKDNADDDSYGGGMTEHELGLVDSTTIISTMDFDAADNSAHLMKECQSGLAVSLSENKSGGEALKREFVTKERRDAAAKSFGTIYDLGIHTTHSLAQNSFEVLENPPTLETNSREESKRRCMTERVLGSIDSTTRALSTDFDAADNSAHLVRPYQSGPVVSLSGNENRGEASKTECITKRILGSEDLQQNSGGRRDNAAKSFGAIYDPGIHTTHSLAQNSFEVLEALLTRKQPNDSVPLLSLGRFRVEGCVQEGKSQDLPRLMQIDGVEQRVTKSHRYLGGFTAQSTSSSPWPIGLPNGRHIVVLNLLEKSTKNVAHVAMADQCSPTVPLPEKKMVRRTLKRKYRIMSVIFSTHQQHFCKRCEGPAKSFRVTRICRNHGINCVSMVKRIHKQHGINQWLFRQKWATKKGHSLGEKRPYEVSSLPMDLPRSLKLDCSGGLGAQSAVGLPDGGYVLSVGKTLKRKCKTMSLFSLEDDQQHGVKRWGDAAKSLGRKRICRQLVVQHVSIAKRIHRQHVFHRWPFQQNWETMKVYSVRDKRPVEVLSLSTDGKLVSRLQLVHISWLVKFLPRPSAYRGGEIVGPIALLSSEFAATNNRAHGIRNDQSGSSSASHSENNRPGEPEDFEERDGRISYEDLQKLFCMNRQDAAKILNGNLLLGTFHMFSTIIS
ncbi:hypothetical protein Vadar_028395 [Vaccinium darrowii]|uniref:Uncharacterized protein n=1 Tax=Vaccinium darrowii TaxID=229202 RepID=A0ACB7YGN5_9ERIC|nr:hypothetical protein Vadar_028395 [Vaccinium darrowii]